MLNDNSNAYIYHAYEAIFEPLTARCVTRLGRVSFHVTNNEFKKRFYNTILWIAYRGVKYSWLQ